MKEKINRYISDAIVKKLWVGCPHCTTKRSKEARMHLRYKYCEHCGRPLTEESMNKLKSKLKLALTELIKME